MFGRISGRNPTRSFIPSQRGSTSSGAGVFNLYFLCVLIIFGIMVRYGGGGFFNFGGGYGGYLTFGGYGGVL